MNAKEQAENLIDKFYNSNSNGDFGWMTKEDAKQCALIAIANEISSILWLSILCTFDNPMKEHFNNKLEELKQVEQEINEYN